MIKTPIQEFGPPFYLSSLGDGTACIAHQWAFRRANELPGPGIPGYAYRGTRVCRRGYLGTPGRYLPGRNSYGGSPGNRFSEDFPRTRVLSVAKRFCSDNLKPRPAVKRVKRLLLVPGKECRLVGYHGFDLQQYYCYC
eukprot:3251199-Rhodomonas_salina.1